MSENIQFAYRRHLRRMTQCRKYVPVIECKVCGGRSGIRLRCNSRWCQSCSIVYAKRLQEKYSVVLKQYRKIYTLKLLTLTLAHNGSVKQRVERIKHAWKALWNEIKTPSSGALVVIELGLGNHVHIHAIVHIPYISVYDLSRRWHNITGDSKVVHIQKVYNDQGALRYLLKYLFKGIATMPSEEQFRAFHNSRRLWTSGVFFGFKVRVRLQSICGECASVDCIKLVFDDVDDRWLSIGLVIYRILIDSS